MSKSRPLVPPPGNAARPVFFFLLVAFGLMLVGFPVLMVAVGLGTASIIWITLLILAVTVGILWFTIRLGQNLQQDEARLDAGEVWAEWTVPRLEYQAFVAEQRASTNRHALFVGLGGAILGLGWWLIGDDLLTASIMIVVFLLAALITWLFAGPPRSARDDRARRVRIGPSGVHLLGRYMPFETTMTRLRAVDIEEGDPSVMRFVVRSGRQHDQILVPVPADQRRQAELVADRLRQMHDL